MMRLYRPGKPRIYQMIDILLLGSVFCCKPIPDRAEQKFVYLFLTITTFRCCRHAIHILCINLLQHFYCAFRRCVMAFVKVYLSIFFQHRMKSILFLERTYHGHIHYSGQCIMRSLKISNQRFSFSCTPGLCLIFRQFFINIQKFVQTFNPLVH